MSFFMVFLPKILSVEKRGNYEKTKDCRLLALKISPSLIFVE